MTGRDRFPALDARLTLALQMAQKTRTAADIGADHGRLSLALLTSGLSERVLVSDVSEKSLMKAKRLLCAHGQEQKAIFAVADGLDALASLPEGQADTVFLLGMGGETLGGILQRGASQLRGADVILGAQTELPLLRQRVCHIGYRLRDEQIAWDNGRAYVLMRCSPMAEGEPGYDQRQLLLGPVLLQALPPEWLPALRRRRELLIEANTAMAQAHRDKDRQRLAESVEELGYVEEALKQLAKATVPPAE